MAHVDINEKLATLFQPDVLLPLQYFETIKRKAEAIPEKDLMRAVLEDAVCCFQKYLLVTDGRGRILFKEAERWMFDDDDSEVFSYRNVCDVLGIDGDYLRCGLLRWKEKHLSSRLKGRLCRIRKRHHVRRE
jgi:hypothetical protein